MTLPHSRHSAAPTSNHEGPRKTTMEKIGDDTNGFTSPDLAQRNQAHLRRLFPEAFPDGVPDFEILRQLLGAEPDREPGEERFGLSWHGKRRARDIALAPSAGALRPHPADNPEWSGAGHLFIEGDNLEVLKLLQKSYAGLVKAIYIDPPYNTGKDFVYPDDFRDSIANYLAVTGQTGIGTRRRESNTDAGGRLHTNWLNMIYPRLRLARELLRNDGILLVSISDVELGNLRLICDELFGGENFVDTFVVRSNPRGNQAKKLTASEHEYIVAYARDIDRLPALGTVLTDEEKKEYGKRDGHGHYRELGLRKRGAGARRQDAPSLYYPLYAVGGEVTTEPPEQGEYREILPRLSSGEDGRWRWSRETASGNRERLLAREVREPGGKRHWDVFEKDYLRADKKRKFRSILYDKKYNYENATEEVAALLGEKTFTYPKPVALVADLLENAGVTDGDLVLDFFAGSGTTGHAVMLLNARDGGRRRFILVQLPEPLSLDAGEQHAGAVFCRRRGLPATIAELAKERLRQAASAIRKEYPDSLPDPGFRVFTLDSSNIKEWDAKPKDVRKALSDAVRTVKKGREADDVFFEVLLKTGLRLDEPVLAKKAGNHLLRAAGGCLLVACLSEDIPASDVPALAGEIADWRRELDGDGGQVVFRDSAFPDDVAKTNMEVLLRQQGVPSVGSI